MAEKSVSRNSRVLNLDEEFSHREAEVIFLLAEGYRTREIAIKLGRSENSIKQNLRTIREKTGVTSTVEFFAKLYGKGN